MGSYTSPLPTPFYLGETGQIKLVNGFAYVKFQLEHNNPNYHVCITSEANEHYYFRNRTLQGFELYSGNGRSVTLVHWHIKD